MRRKAITIAVCAAAIGVVILVWFLAQPPILMESKSPDGMYQVQIRTQKGFGLLNVSEHLTITVRKASSLQRATIYATLDNNDDPIMPERHVHVIWESDKLIIILLGHDQLPEIITVSLEKGFPCERHQYDISPNDIYIILKKYGISWRDI